MTEEGTGLFDDDIKCKVREQAVVRVEGVRMHKPCSIYFDHLQFGKLQELTGVAAESIFRMVLSNGN